jgi:uncharacterized RDD family membrane protein YckC
MTAATSDAPPAFERERDNQAWARWLGRLIDRILLLPFGFAIFVALGILVEMGRLPYEFIGWLDSPLTATIGEVLILFALAALWEPLFLSNTGTTPGKWIMGVRVKRADGRNVGLITAYGRFLWVYTIGLGLGIPFIALICMLTARAKLVGDGVTAWDQNLDLHVTHAKRHPIVWIFAFVLVVCTNIGLAILGNLPE